MRSLADIDFNAKGGVKKSNETIDYSQSAEPTLDASKEDTLKGHLSYLAKAVKWLRDNKVETNPTANATEITNLNNWFNANINSYIIPEDLMYEFLSDNIPMVEMLVALNGASCTLTSYNLDFKMAGVDINTLTTNLSKKGGYEVYVENDIDSITTSGICTLKFKIDGHNVIIECYKKAV